MAKFKKPIVSAGVFLVGSDGGERHTEVITPDRLKHWSNQFKKMKKNGVMIPAPWKHTNEAIPVQMGNNGTLPSSEWNAGFWDDLTVEVNEQGNSTLYGIVDVPGDKKDFNTPAGKIGTTVKETSIYARPKFVDGKGNIYDDSIMHVALVTHPIEPGQGNFEPIEEGMTIAMSHCQHILMASENIPFNQSGKTPSETPGSDSDNDSLESDAPTGDLKTIIELLSKVGIILPKDTSDENLKERLSVSLQQKISGEEEEDEEEGSLTKPPKDAEKESVPMIMSTTPETKEITAEVIMGHPAYIALADQNKQLFSVMNQQAKNSRATRINALIRTGRISKEYADTHLVPMLSGFKMSFNAEGQEVSSALDVTLGALEAQPQRTVEADLAGGQKPNYANAQIAQLAPFLMSSVAPEGSESPSHPIQGFMTDGVLSEAESEDVAKRFMANVGIS